jgi:outer membrane protein W
MKNFIAFLAFVMMSQAQAQAPAQVQVVTAAPQAPIVAQAKAPQAKKTLIYDERTNQLVEVTPQVQAMPATAEAVATAPSSAPIYILNNQKLQGYQGAVQDAPTTVVQEAPVKVSPSETLRKERAGAEAATEDGIVQTLEKARLDDEVRRRNKFNDALNSTVSGMTQPATAAPAAPVAAPVAPVAAPTAAAIVEENEVVEVAPQKPQRASKRKKVILEDETADDRSSDKVDVKAEVRAAIAEQTAAPLNLTSYYVSALVGTQSYDSANVHGKLASGLSIGMVTPDRFVAEGSFVYAQNQVDDIAGPNPTFQRLNMNQYNFSAAAKYQLLPGKLRPTVGGIASYTRRSYEFANNSYYGNSNATLATTDAFDAGLEAGLDLALTNNFSIGADFRYLWNIASITRRTRSLWKTSLTISQVCLRSLRSDLEPILKLKSAALLVRLLVPLS